MKIYAEYVGKKPRPWRFTNPAVNGGKPLTFGDQPIEVEAKDAEYLKQFPKSFLISYGIIEQSKKGGKPKEVRIVRDLNDDQVEILEARQRQLAAESVKKTATPEEKAMAEEILKRTKELEEKEADLKEKFLAEREAEKPLPPPTEEEELEASV